MPKPRLPSSCLLISSEPKAPHETTGFFNSLLGPENSFTSVGRDVRRIGQRLPEIRWPILARLSGQLYLELLAASCVRKIGPDFGNLGARAPEYLQAPVAAAIPPGPP